MDKIGLATQGNPSRSYLFLVANDFKNALPKTSSPNPIVGIGHTVDANVFREMNGGKGIALEIHFPHAFIRAHPNLANPVFT